MANSAGPATSAKRTTQGLAARRKKKGAALLTPEQKKLKGLLLGASSARVKRAFDLGLRSTNLAFLAAHLWAELVRIDEAVVNDELSESSAITTKSKIFDLLRRIHDKLDSGPAIPDEIMLQVETIPGLKMETDRPQSSDS